MSRVWIGIARALMSIIFLLAGVGKLINWEGTVGSLTTTFSKWYMHLEGMGISGEFHEFLMGSSVVILGIATVLEIAGGLFLLIGYKVRIGAVFLLLFLIPVTFIFHPFWFEVGSEKHVEIGNFFKNLSIIGALIYLLAAPQLKPKNR